ncbi:MAG TPA: choice-of-anchor R domain-containing protein [Rhizomicrobium sp.]|jgi:hypothetical protein
MIDIRSLALATVLVIGASAPVHALSGARATADDKGLVTIFDNFAHKYPKALYLDLTSVEIRGGGGGALQSWSAAPFTPAADHVVTKIEVPVSIYTGKNGLVLSLNSDADGVPGDALKSWNLKDLPPQGSCCVVETAKDAQGIAIKAGKQYWIVLSTNSKEGSTWADWLEESEDQVDSESMANYDNVYGWQPSTITPSLAFAVLGSK